jgi:hypothetical protein
LNLGGDHRPDDAFGYEEAYPGEHDCKEWSLVRGRLLWFVVLLVLVFVASSFW